MIIAVDFDGICVTHEYPNIGKEIGAVPVLKWLVEQGHQLILWTMRGDARHNKYDLGLEGDLAEAVSWFRKHDIPLYGINNNPTQSKWTQSPKAYANVYIDDAALGAPLAFNKELSDRPFIDWIRVKAYIRAIEAGDILVGHTTLVEDSDANT